MHGPSVSTATELRELRLDPEKAANLMEAQLDPQVAQGPFGKGGALEWVATLTDAWATLALAQLHFFDDDDVRDSSKNLQVLWSRGLLAHNGQLHDPVAIDLLPVSTRWFIQSGIIDFVAPWLEWIQARTEWLNSGMEAFLSSPSCAGDKECQVVIWGAGFDTRSLRYQKPGLTFWEVDLPETIAAKRCVHERYKREVKPEIQLPTLVGMDLNECETSSLLARLEAEHGFKRGVPTLFISEAVLFYVNPKAIANLFGEVFDYGRTAEAMYSFTDSMRPFVEGPFADEIRTFLEQQDAQLLEHAARWGGAVQFMHAVSSRTAADALPAASEGPSLREHLTPLFTPPLNSYAPERFYKPKDNTPSFVDKWYAICYTSELEMVEADAPYATRLFGEPLTLRRDARGAVRCTHVTAEGDEATLATRDHQGLVWLWRGDPATADDAQLPTHPTPEATHTVETILDYGVDWTYIVENNLDTPHLYWLHDGSIPPIESLGCNRANVGSIGLRFFRDDVGEGHIGKTKSKTTKVVRFDAPNVVRHGGVSGFSEEFNIVPLGPHRTRVLLRQRFPKGPILSTLLGVPGVDGLLRYLVRNWNYQIGLEDYSVMQGQAHNINDLAAPNYGALGTGDDLIVKFWQWKRKASLNDAGSKEAVAASAVDGAPEYFTRWDGSRVDMDAALAAAAAAPPPRLREEGAGGGGGAGNWPAASEASIEALRPHYREQQPVAAFPPINNALYKRQQELVTTVPQFGIASLTAVAAASVATAAPPEVAGLPSALLADLSQLLGSL